MKKQLATWIKLPATNEMKQKTVSGTMLTLLIIGMLTLAFDIQPVKASGTIYIRADGSIDPPTANITSVDNVTYTFTDNIYDDIVVLRSNIIIDGNGYTLQGTGIGFTLPDLINNVTIKNTNIKGFSYGVYLILSFNNTIYGNNIANTDYAVYLSGSSNNNITGNNITNSSEIGVELSSSSNNTISGNNIINCVWYDIFLSISSNNNITGNTIAGRPWTYYGVGLEHSSNNSIAENNIIDNGYGVYLRWSSSNNTISGNNITNNGRGVYLEDSSNNNIAANKITKNQNGVYLEDSSNNNISGNNITNNEYSGVKLWPSNNNNVTGNDITNNYAGISLYGSSDNTVYHNNFMHNTKQVYFSMEPSPNVWDDGYPSGGNYWSDYNGTDYYGGPYQNETRKDGIGDTPYIINAENQDRYPLMSPWGLPSTIYVPTRYPTIQAAINVANPGDTIFVYSGTYYENVVVNKTLTLIGENRATTIIDGSNTGTVVNVTSSNVSISGFTIQHSGPLWQDSGIYLGSVSNCNISGNTITNNSRNGVHLWYSSRNSISGNTITNNEYGVFTYASSWKNGFQESMGNNITNNNITNNNERGVFLLLSSYDAISGNNITNNNIGVHLWNSANNNSISGNTITNNSLDGVRITLFSFNNTISGNTITNNSKGPLATPDWAAITIDSPGNSIYHNNIIDNGYQVCAYPFYANTWDDGYPSGGNYWSDYNGTDYYSGPYQNETGNDGIGDIPYTIDAGNQDRYPLVSPWPTRIIERIVKIGRQNYTITMKNNATITDVTATRNTLHFTTSGPTGQGAYINVTFPVGLNKTAIKVFVDEEKITPPPYPIITTNGTHYSIYFEFILSTHNITIQYATADIAVTNVVPYKTVICQGYSASVNVTIQNQGNYTENFNTTVYANTTIIATLTNVTLTNGTSTIVTFLWNTTGVAKGNYTISAVADIVPGETDTADNTYIDGFVIVAMVGDITGPDGWPDGKCDIRDIALVARYFGQNVPPAPPNCDLTGPTTGVPDGKIDIRDIALVAKNFGKIDP